MELLKRIEKKLDVLQANSGSTLGYVQVTNEEAQEWMNIPRAR